MPSGSSSLKVLYYLYPNMSRVGIRIRGTLQIQLLLFTHVCSVGMELYNQVTVTEIDWQLKMIIGVIYDYEASVVFTMRQ